MSYTVEEFYINSKFPPKEKKVLDIWRNFCLKSPPLPELGKGSLSIRHDKILDYFEKNFVNNLCFLENNDKFAIFGEGKRWLDDPSVALPNGKICVMIMGGTSKKTHPYLLMNLLKEFFRRLKENHDYKVVAWNQNRVFRRKPFERLMGSLGGKQTGDCHYVEL